MHPQQTVTSCERAAATGTRAGSRAELPAPKGSETLKVVKTWQEMVHPGGGTCFSKLSCFLRSPPPPHKMRDV